MRRPNYLDALIWFSLLLVLVGVFMAFQGCMPKEVRAWNQANDCRTMPGWIVRGPGDQVTNYDGCGRRVDGCGQTDCGKASQ